MYRKRFVTQVYINFAMLNNIIILYVVLCSTDEGYIQNPAKKRNENRFYLYEVSEHIVFVSKFYARLNLDTFCYFI